MNPTAVQRSRSQGLASFEAELDTLRRLGEAFALRRFGGELNRADAEDVVSEVLIRFHARFERGWSPDNLRAAFFTSVRNAAIDQLRSRNCRPTAPLEAAFDAPATGPTPGQHAESREEMARFQEALGRMRRNYREVLVLRFGVGLTVPEIAERQGISLAAAKKRVLRATRQVKKRFAEVASSEHCREMQQITRRSLAEKQLSGVATAEQVELLERHLAHCGQCKAFLSELRHAVHDYATGALLAGGAVSSPGRHRFADHIPAFVDRATDAVHAGAAKLRLAAFKLASAAQGTEASGGAGAMVGAPQKIVAICSAGAATAATCLATGVVGPGVGPGIEPPSSANTPPAVSAAPASAPLADPEPTPLAAKTPVESVKAQGAHEFGFERAAAGSKGTSEFGAPAHAPATASPGGGGSSGGSSAGSGGFGFEK